MMNHYQKMHRLQGCFSHSHFYPHVKIAGENFYTVKYKITCFAFSSFSCAKLDALQKIFKINSNKFIMQIIHPH